MNENRAAAQGAEEIADAGQNDSFVLVVVLVLDPVTANSWVTGAGRQRRIAGGDAVEVVGGPTGELAAQLGFEFEMVGIEAGKLAPAGASENRIEDEDKWGGEMRPKSENCASCNFPLLRGSVLYIERYIIRPE